METNPAFWARPHVIPFRKSFLGREDTTLGDRLRDELSGILTLIVNAIPDFLEHGLNPPPIVLDATAGWRAGRADGSPDPVVALQAFLADCCWVARGKSVYRTELHNAFRSWAERTGREVAVKAEEVYRIMNDLGHPSGGAAGRMIQGLALCEQDHPLPETEDPRA